MVAERIEVRGGILKKREIPSNLVEYLPKKINSEFGGRLSDDMPLRAIAEEVPNLNGGRTAVKLVEAYWQGIEATVFESAKIRTFFRFLFSHAPDIDTFGKLRKACEEKQIAKISGLGDMAEIFFAKGFAKLPQGLQVISGTENGLSSSF